MWSIHTLEYYSAIKKEWSSDVYYETDKPWRGMLKKEASQKHHTVYYISRVSKSMENVLNENVLKWWEC